MFNFKKKARDAHRTQIFTKLEILDAYQKLQSNIRFISVDKPVQVMLITSSLPSEGKTTVSSNLAYSYARVGKKVVIVDLDLRKSRVHHAFQIDNEAGVVDYLIGDLGLPDLIRTTEEGVDVLTSGGRAEIIEKLIQSQRMAELVNKLREMYDVVILDSAPIMVSSDSQALSTIVDGVVLVCETNFTKKAQLKESLRLLQLAKANVLGIVLTKVKLKDIKYNKYYNY